jgi:hypothetical protein
MAAFSGRDVETGDISVRVLHGRRRPVARQCLRGRGRIDQTVECLDQQGLCAAPFGGAAGAQQGMAARIEPQREGDLLARQGLHIGVGAAGGRDLAVDHARKLADLAQHFGVFFAGFRGFGGLGCRGFGQGLAHIRPGRIDFGLFDLWPFDFRQARAGDQRHAGRAHRFFP